MDGNHGTLQYEATFGPGLVEQAFYLDGLDDFVDVPNSPSLNFGTHNITIDFWVKFNSVAGSQVMIEKFAQKMQIPANSTGWTLVKLWPGHPKVGVLFSLQDAGMFV